MNLQKSIKSIVVASLIFSFVQESSAIQIIEKKVGQQIVGHAPFFRSIGSEVVESNSVQNIDGIEYKSIAVGAKIQVPSHLFEFNNETPNPLFDFVDLDLDVAASKGNANIGVVPMNPTLETPIRWFLIQAKPGYRFADETDKEGEVITNWTDEAIQIVTEIDDEQFVNYTEENQNSKVLIVPEGAIGYRIGFWALPQTENGVPSVGQWVKVFDLGQYFGQTETSPGSTVEEDENCSKLTCGTAIKPNPGGGGGIVSGEDWIINIYDEATNKLITELDPIKVNRTYYATIRIRTKGPLTDIAKAYRDPTEAELATLTWNIFDINTDEVLASYKPNDESDRVNNDAGTVDIGSETFKKYTFRTQSTNNEADPELQKLEPNFSEQGFGLGIEISILDN